MDLVSIADSAGSTTMPGFDVIWNSQLFDGRDSVTRTVPASTACRVSTTACTFAMVGEDAAFMRSMLATTAWAFTGVPLANFAPPSRLNV